LAIHLQIGDAIQCTSLNRRVSSLWARHDGLRRARLFVPYPDPWDTILSVAISHDHQIHVIRRCQHTLDQGALVTQSDVERTGSKKLSSPLRAIGQIVTPLALIVMAIISS
jgi:hypothetical protein